MKKDSAGHCFMLNMAFWYDKLITVLPYPPTSLLTRFGSLPQVPFRTADAFWTISPGKTPLIVLYLTGRIRPN